MTSPQSQRRSLILGGVKSGKSGHAERLADACSKVPGSNVVLIATATARDEEMRKRIERHRGSRNKNWLVIEEPLALSTALSKADQAASDAGVSACIVIDCLTLWVTNLLLNNDEGHFRQEIDSFQQSVSKCQSRLIIVSNETNMGVTPMGELSRRFCDEIGLLHQALGKICDNVTLMVAGIPLIVKKNTHSEP